VESPTLNKLEDLGAAIRGNDQSWCCTIVGFANLIDDFDTVRFAADVEVGDDKIRRTTGF
jgi:hypothetical protein